MNLDNYTVIPVRRRARWQRVLMAPWYWVKCVYVLNRARGACGSWYVWHTLKLATGLTKILVRP